MGVDRHRDVCHTDVNCLPYRCTLFLTSVCHMSLCLSTPFAYEAQLVYASYARLVNMSGNAMAACRGCKTRSKRLRIAGRCKWLLGCSRKSRQTATHSSFCRSAHACRSHTVVHRLLAHTIVHGARRPHLEWDTYVVSCSGFFVFCVCIVVHACASVDA